MTFDPGKALLSLLKETVILLSESSDSASTQFYKTFEGMWKYFLSYAITNDASHLIFTCAVLQNTLIVVQCCDAEFPKLGKNTASESKSANDTDDDFKSPLKTAKVVKLHNVTPVSATNSFDPLSNNNYVDVADLLSKVLIMVKALRELNLLLKALVLTHFM